MQPVRYCPVFLLVLLQVGIATAQTIVNPSLEQWALLGVCETNTAPDFWVNFSNGGLGPDEGNYPLCPSTIPGRASAGQVYARFMAGNPRSGEGMAQSISGFSPGKPYTLTFDFAGSNLWGGSDSMRVHVFLDGVDIDSTISFSSTDTLWRHHGATFIPTNFTHSLGVRIYTHRFPSAGGSGALDNFGLEQFAITGTASIPARADWEVSPSIFSDFIMLHGPPGETVRCEWFDLSGRSVYSSQGAAGSFLYPDLPDGIYEVAIIQEGRFLFRKKVVRLER